MVRTILKINSNGFKQPLDFELVNSLATPLNDRNSKWIPAFARMTAEMEDKGVVRLSVMFDAYEKLCRLALFSFL